MADDFPFPSKIEVLPPWEAAARLFLERGGGALVLGAPDTGKSTLSHYLVSQAYAAGQPAALVDLDLGQSHLGPPGALGLGLFPPLLPGEGCLSPQGLYFLGQTSPLGAILEVAVGCQVLADEAVRRGVARLVVNTSGFVQGPEALRLKRAQAELLQPRLILALQRERELEPLLRGLGGGPERPRSGADPPPSLRAASRADFGTANDDAEEQSTWQILRLPVSARAGHRDPETRCLYREARFRGYFQQAANLHLPWGSFTWEGLPVPGGWQDQALLTPLAPAAASQVRFVKLGKLRLNLEGQELPHG